MKYFLLMDFLFAALYKHELQGDGQRRAGLLHGNMFLPPQQ